MRNFATVPDEADDLRQMAKALLRVRMPAALRALLLALLAALFGAAALRASAAAHPLPTDEELEDFTILAESIAYAHRVYRYGWMYRMAPGLGMNPTVWVPPYPRPIGPARAPPRRAPIPRTP